MVNSYDNSKLEDHGISYLTGSVVTRLLGTPPTYIESDTWRSYFDEDEYELDDEFSEYDAERASLDESEPEPEELAEVDRRLQVCQLCGAQLPPVWPNRALVRCWGCGAMTTVAQP